MLELIGDVVLCLMIICGGVIFLCANINYLPEEEDPSEDHNKK